MAFDSTSLSDTQRSLLLTSLNVFAENGIDGMSVRAITKMAGAKNTSAIYYHFKSKDQLIETLINNIQDWFDQERDPLLVALEEATELDERSLRQLLSAVAYPYITLLQTEEWGHSAVRFLARVEYENSQVPSDALNKRSQVAVGRIMHLLKQCVPTLPEKRLKQRFNYFLNSLIQGLANYKHLENSYLGDLSVDSFESLAEFYIDCGELVILAPEDRC
ncbi:TetR/AcrR family transcriptional regulator [Pseudomaricurvus alkylphenolicus]|uniref:TetR/AcrR family transcriptional regulator n=1 Tax=Pseudomaricurvus alkylphenolicus TaxID=1306991 RepID=UPI0014220B8F|nr:TetR/AcrR family transcriptional regulator [Pseudomaricurvus alkylphenolicus]NIB45112.1 TetR/AcrR family transcriptional regulator [Pseudomaricurvus alkylphenolicus]